MNNNWIYFDYAATTPCDKQVVAQYCAELSEGWGFANTGGTYAPALANRDKLAQAREQLAAVIGADAREIIFTSGATEADNLALKGALTHHTVKHPGLLTLQTEHKAILDSAAVLAKSGSSVKVLPVERNGVLNLAVLEEALKTPTTLVSVMAVNNETGVIQPIEEIAACVHRAGAKLHVDAAQALGKIPVNAKQWDADMISLSGHKIYAPKGIGALYVRRLPKMRLEAQMHGGGQERGNRSGTSPVALIRAFTLAAEIAETQRAERYARVQKLRDDLWQSLHAGIGNNVQAGTPQVPHIQNLNLQIPAAVILAAANEAGLALSAGSACLSGGEGSHVLQAMGLSAVADKSIRVSLSHLTTSGELAKLIAFLNEKVS